MDTESDGVGIDVGEGLGDPLDEGRSAAPDTVDVRDAVDVYDAVEVADSLEYEHTSSHSGEYCATSSPLMQLMPGKSVWVGPHVPPST